MKTPPLSVDVPDPPNLDYHHGALRPVAGVQSFQVLRANRERPDAAEGTGWTYNHAPMLAYWKNRFWLHYLSNPVGEHAAPGHTLLTESPDGRTWARPRVVFPVYRIPRGINAQFDEDPEGAPEEAVMHQRMGFHVAPDGRLLTLGFYGYCPKPTHLPFDRRGIGRVVREVRGDGSFGPVYFIHINRQAGWAKDTVAYPFYTESDDPGFVEACESLLADPLLVQQWCEEHGSADEKVRLKGRYKSLAFYTLEDGRAVGFWKWAIGGVTRDRGETWEWLGEVPGLENAGGKVWAQRTGDGSYALVYNPSTNNKHRWPLAVVTSDGGLRFGGLLLAEGECPPRRYAGGAFKDFGMNYVRGIVEGNGAPPDGGLWIAYSMNKEDIWVTRLPVPVTASAERSVEDMFAGTGPGPGVPGWNVYSPLWAPVSVADTPDGDGRCLRMEDGEPRDYARAERAFAPLERGSAELRVRGAQGGGKPLFVELWDGRGAIPVRVVFDTDGMVRVQHGRKTDAAGRFSRDCWHTLRFVFDTVHQRCVILFDGADTGRNQSYQGDKPPHTGWLFRAPVRSIERLVLRTGPVRRSPDLDTPVDGGEDLPDVSQRLAPSVFFVSTVRIGPEDQTVAD